MIDTAAASSLNLDDVDDNHHPQVGVNWVPNSDYDRLSNPQIFAAEEIVLSTLRTQDDTPVHRVHLVSSSGDGAPCSKA